MNLPTLWSQNFSPSLPEDFAHGLLSNILSSWRPPDRGRPARARASRLSSTGGLGPVASSFLRWRTEEWEATPIACRCEWVGATFGGEHGKCAQHSSQPACSLVRTLPPHVSTRSSRTHLLKLKRRRLSARRRLTATGKKARRGRISVATTHRSPRKALSRGEGQTRIGR
jgi:hypothetical protein